MENSLLISVITVSYNAVSTIESTILSVINQTYPNIEYIIIDGGSTDGTVDIIKKYADRISYWVSERDDGIYAAMNKGVNIAKGEWVNFMNSGDSFYDNNIISNVFGVNDLDSKISIIYGKTYKKYHYRNKIEIPPKLEFIKKRLPFCHQSCFIKTDLLRNHPYNTNYKLVADDEFFYSMYVQGEKFFFIDTTIANYEAYLGISSQKMKEALYENYRIRGGKHYFYFLFFIYFPIAIKQNIHSFILSKHCL
ncbi:glycosyltransferase family 2 protein [Phocaeicola sp.]